MAKGGLNSLSEQWQNILDEYKQDFSKELNVALEEATNVMKGELVKASPVGNYPNRPSNEPHFKDCWIAVMKYTNVKYIGNTKVTKNGHTPLSSILEWSSKGKPFIRNTFESNKDMVYQKVVNSLKKGK